MGGITTYNPREVIISLGIHTVSGYAEERFVAIEKLGSGMQSRTGCDGEIVRTMDSNRQYKITLNILGQSKSNDFLLNSWKNDSDNGDGMFPITIKDLRGGLLFSADAAWVTKPTVYQFGRTVNETQWEIITGEGRLGVD
jgi:hypothetical protein